MEWGAVMAVKSFRRQLDTRTLLQNFLEHVLNIKADDKTISEILEAERNTRDFESHPSSTHDDFRVSKYREDSDREELRGKILAELIAEERLKNDSEITLNCGGAKPANVLADAQAFVVSGAPASGKSGIASILAERSGAYILDSDYAKRKFPEFSEYSCGASLLHKESDSLIFGESGSLYEYCVYNRYNIVIPLVGRTENSMRDICKRLAQAGYTIHMVNVRLDRLKCARRAYSRFLSEKRYVPLSYVLDEVGNEPERIYYILRLEGGEINRISSFAQISTDVPMGQDPILLDATESSPVRSYFEKEAVLA